MAANRDQIKANEIDLMLQIEHVSAAARKSWA